MAECMICEKLREKKANIIYEDDDFVAIIPNKPAVAGHIKVMPKKHFSKIDEMSEELTEEMFFIANFSSSAVFDAFKAHGSNIILNESQDHIAVDIMPRKEGDGLSFNWKPKQSSPEELDSVLAKIKDKAFGVGKKADKKPLPNLDEKPKIIISEEPEQKQEKKDENKKIKGRYDEENYLIRQLHKIP